MAETEFLAANTSDGLRLHGALVWPGYDAALAPGWPQAVVTLHGAGGNFYSSPPFPDLIAPLLARGVVVLRANTRGHDTIAGAGGGRLPQGAAYEIVDDCRRDLDAWCKALRDRGLERVALVGHSLGALKAVYGAAYGLSSPVASVVAISPPRLSCRLFLDSARAEEFSAALQQAQALVADDRPLELMRIRFPVPLLISAASYVDKYGPQERYDILRIAKVLKTPTRFIYGGRELDSSPAFAGLPDAIRALLDGSTSDVQLVDDADHNYSGSTSALAALIDEWFATRG